MPRHAVMVFLMSSLAVRATAVEVEVTVTVTHLNPGGFVEFKAESDERGEKATGHLTVLGKTNYFRWNMGGADQNIWFWWDTLDGQADLKIVVIGAPRIPVTLVEASCVHNGKGEVQVGRTLRASDPRTKHYRRNRGCPPYIAENKTGAITHLKQGDDPPRRCDGKAGPESSIGPEG